MRRLSFHRWGYEDEVADEVELTRALGSLRAFFGDTALGVIPLAEPNLSEIELRPPRVAAPASLLRVCTTEPYERARHALGRSFRDLVRGYARDFSSAPDLVAFPASEGEIVALLDFAAEQNVAVIPFGGGTSVCGGVEPAVGDGFAGTLSLDLSRLSRVVEIDEASLAARIEAGALGPAIEDALRPRGLTLRHYPQSFEFSTLGGWLATRSGGHFATLHTHIDDFCEALRVVTPRGIAQTRRLPASGAGPAPERLWLGSEGALGIITEAWMRITERPRFRANAVVSAPDFTAGARIVKALAQSGLHPSNARLLDPLEAFIGRAGDGSVALVLVAFESAHHEVDVDLSRALECARDAGGTVEKGESRQRKAPSLAGADAETDAASAWKRSFLRAPYLRDAIVARGFVVETFETAITWDRFDAFHEGVREATLRAATEICGAAVVSTRVTHAYPDGAAPYYTVIAPGAPNGMLAQWDEVKRAATEAILAHGGTVTHHHAVGRDVVPFYEKERPDLFAQMLAAAKDAVDPRSILNPGVLFPSRR